MSVIVRCPSCGQMSRVADNLRGQVVNCPHCRKPFAVAAAADGPAAEFAANFEVVGARGLPDEVGLSEQFGRYHLGDRLGGDRTGDTYRATDSRPVRTVVLKLPRFMPGDLGAAERFLREVRAAADLRHPNVCPVLDVGQFRGVPYAATEYLEGQPLSRLLRRERPFPQAEAAALVRKLAQALAAAHGAGLLHRDLKPSNVFVTRSGEPMVLDFGMSPPAASAYTAPEQVSGGLCASGPAADVYSLGAILYALLTGRVPYEGTASEMLAQVLRQPPALPSLYRHDLDPQLEAACLQAMARRPSDRFASAGDLARALSAWVQRSAPAAPPGGREKPAAQWMYASRGQRHGPVAWPELRQLAASGRVRPDDQVCRAGSDVWFFASTVDGLFSADPVAVEPRLVRRVAAPRADEPLDVQLADPPIPLKPEPPRRPAPPVLLCPDPPRRPENPGGTPGWVFAVGGALCLAVGLSVVVGLAWYMVSYNPPAKATGPVASAPAPAAGPARGPQPQPPPPPDRDLSAEQIVSSCEASVALIRHPAGSGTGFVVGPGLVATNSHVIAEATVGQIQVSFPQAQGAARAAVTPELLYEDERRDLAILRVPTNLAPLRVAERYEFRRGQRVTVIGNEGDLVSAVKEGLMSTQVEIDGLGYYQLSIAINPGSSGGPVFNPRGEVVAVVTLKARNQEGIAFGVPARDLLDAVAKARSAGRQEVARVTADHDRLAGDAPRREARGPQLRLSWKPGLQILQAMGQVLDGAHEIGRMTGYGFDDGISILGAYVQPGATVAINRPLQGGKRYLLLAGGDNDARDVDVELLDDDGQVVARDDPNRPLPRAAVQLVPPRDGTYKLRLKLNGAGTACFCACALLREGGWNVRLEVLAKATLRLILFCNLVDERHKGSVRFHKEGNQWAVYGSILREGEEMVASNLGLGDGRRVAVAAGDDGARDVNLYLLDDVGREVARDEAPNPTPLIEHRAVRGQRYGLRWTNVASAGRPALVMTTLLELD